MIGKWEKVIIKEKIACLIGITYELWDNLDKIDDKWYTKIDYINMYYFMHAAATHDYEIEYIWLKTWSYRKHNQIRSINDERFKNLIIK